MRSGVSRKNSPYGKRRSRPRRARHQRKLQRRPGDPGNDCIEFASKALAQSALPRLVPVKRLQRVRAGGSGKDDWQHSGTPAGKLRAQAVPRHAVGQIGVRRLQPPFQLGGLRLGDGHGGPIQAVPQPRHQVETLRQRQGFDVEGDHEGIVALGWGHVKWDLAAVAFAGRLDRYAVQRDALRARVRRIISMPG